MNFMKFSFWHIFNSHSTMVISYWVFHIKRTKLLILNRFSNVAYNRNNCIYLRISRWIFVVLLGVDGKNTTLYVIWTAPLARMGGRWKTDGIGNNLNFNHSRLLMLSLTIPYSFSIFFRSSIKNTYHNSFRFKIRSTAHNSSISP